MFGRILEDVKYARPNLPGQLGAGLLHTALWGGYLSNWEWGLMRIFRDAMKKYAPDLYDRVIAENYEDDPSVTLCEVEDEPGVLWLANLQNILHHGTAGGLMFAGWYKEWPWLWRHGILAQCFGGDIADFARMIACRLLPPPGPYPMNKYMHSRDMITILGMHHSVSLCAGIPVSLYFSDRKPFQYFGAMCSGGALFMVVPDLFSRMVPKEFERVHLLQEFYGGCVWGYQRIWWFFPATWTLLREVMREPIPVAVKAAFGLASFNLALFNVLVGSVMWLGIFSHAKAMLTVPDEDGEPTPIQRSLSSSPELMLYLQFSAKTELSKVFVASRMLVKAKEARERTAFKDD
eukprot:TRINITY_DN27223_c0_g1_i2.p1 TRINITY_DN27223_c0_g1~~TRINITY_DN27223_c0_g1_i2.p1  ORF type:complete len:348 (+),score=40.82 TRINITY_DN27223_c0_g1_i2:120-1163(+)